MSERTHSDVANTAPIKPARGRYFPYIAGTIVTLVVAGVAFQLFRAEPGAAQTRDAATAGTARVGGATPADEIVARVNNEPVSYEQVARECFERYGAEVLDNIINRRIIEQECDRAGVQITQAEIDQEVLNIAGKFNIDIANWYALLKSERGIDKTQYHRDVIYPMIALKKLAGKKIEVSDDDMRKAFVRDFGPRVEARMILVQGNIRQANEVWQQAMANPDDFGRLARDVSADPNTRPLGGVVPPIRRFGGNDKVEEEAFRLKVGEISPVIDVGESRYVVLKCEGHTKPITTDINEVRAQLHEQLIEEKTQEAVAKVFDTIKNRSSVVNYVSRTSTGGAQATTVAPNGQAPGRTAANPQTATR
ncbi:MAG: peptidylprolyl isomerase [Planctomycetaceae bacterium]|nr:peptidylprolyl isomerase [Planctomycetaceae bacterium]